MYILSTYKLCDKTSNLFYSIIFSGKSFVNCFLYDFIFKAINFDDGLTCIAFAWIEVVIIFHVRKWNKTPK